jgi:hypothetical protein
MLVAKDLTRFFLPLSYSIYQIVIIATLTLSKKKTVRKGDEKRCFPNFFSKNEKIIKKFCEIQVNFVIL